MSRKSSENSSVVYHKTKNPFAAKICMNISFRLLLYIMKKQSLRWINCFVIWILLTTPNSFLARFHCPYASQCSKRDITSTQSRAGCFRLVRPGRIASSRTRIVWRWSPVGMVSEIVAAKSICWRTWNNLDCRWLAINRPSPFSMLRRSRLYDFMCL